MKIKAALLDDDEQFCTLTKILSEKLDKGNKHSLELHTFLRSDDLIQAVDESFDVFVIDWHLHSMDPDGFDVAQGLLTQYPDSVVIMQSADFQMKDSMDSMISKEEISCACIYKKFLKLKRDRENNILEIFLNEGTLDVGNVRSR